MKAQILRGSKEEIAREVSRMAGNIREAIVFVDEAALSEEVAPAENDFAAMQPYMVHVEKTDYSREMIYTAMGEE